MKKLIWFVAVAVMIVLTAGTASAQKQPTIGIRGGVGTDINLGLAYGVGGNYLLRLPRNSVELGVLIFGGNFKESTDEGVHTYDEETSILVIGLLANYLFGYTPRRPGMFFVAGFGLASISVDWEERSDTDTSLGTPLPGGGSKQEDDGSTGGTVFNLGIGRSFFSGLDIRIEIPVIVTFSRPGEAAGVIPTFIATLGYRF